MVNHNFLFLFDLCIIQAEPAKKRKRKVQFDQAETEEKTIDMDDLDDILKEALKKTPYSG